MAPRFSASTATSIEPYAVIMKMGVSRSRSADFFEHLHAALVRHHQIEQDQIVGRCFQPLQPFGGVGGQLDAIVFARQQRFQAFANIGLVVDDQNAAAGSVSAARMSGGKIRDAPAIN